MIRVITSLFPLWAILFSGAAYLNPSIFTFANSSNKCNGLIFSYWSTYSSQDDAQPNGKFYCQEIRIFFGIGDDYEKRRLPPPLPVCASCKIEINRRICWTEDGTGPKGCPTLLHKEIQAEANKEYEVPAIREFARQASIQEAEGYANRDQRPYVMQPVKTRITEICEFAKKMGYQRLGLAFCIGMLREANKVEEIFITHGFEVVSVICKAGRTPKEKIGIKEEEKIFQGMEESICNPIYQAKLLNKLATDFNVMIGMCVGHDSLFFKYSQAPTTVLAVKDRVTGHNPLAAIYLSGSYYQKIKHPEI